MNPGTRLGSYEIQDTIAAGGMGVVYRAKHTTLGRLAAIKVLASNLAVREKVRLRFQQEAYVQAQLDHPSVVNVQDLIADGNTLAIVMDFVDGPDLSVVLEEEAPGPWTLDNVAAVMEPLLDAMAYAHGRSVAHRDIKPSNVLMDRSHGASWPGRPRVTDFGLAKLLSSSAAMTRAGSRMGTIPYMAPEQFMGEQDVDARVDVFALAMFLYRLLTGALPVNEENSLEVAEMYAGRTPIPPIEITGVPDELAQAVMQGLALDPNDRPENAAAFANLVMPHLPSTTDWQASIAKAAPIRSKKPKKESSLSVSDLKSAYMSLSAPDLKLGKVKEKLSQHAAKASDAASQINAKIPRFYLADHIGGFDWRLGIAGLLCMLVYFLPVTYEITTETEELPQSYEVTEDYEGPVTEVKIKTLTYDRLDDDKPTRKSLKEDKADIFEYGFYLKISLILGLGFFCLGASVLRTRGRALPLVMISVFLLLFVAWIHQITELKELYINVHDEFWDDDLIEQKKENIRSHLLWNLRWLGGMGLCVLLGYRAGLAKWPRLHLNWFAFFLAFIAFAMAAFPLEWLDWDYAFGHRKEAESYVKDFFETQAFLLMGAAALSVLALLPKKAGAWMAVFCVLAFPVAYTLGYYLSWTELLLVQWDDMDFEYDFSLSTMVMIESMKIWITSIALALIGYRLAAPTWWRDPSPDETVEEDGGMT